MTKQGRNDMCNCGSNKKYKRCCLLLTQETKYTTGQNVSSQRIIDMVDILQSRFPNCRFIDITDDLNEENYREYQTKNYYTNIVMVAEKTLPNSLVFVEREESMSTDIIIMHKGSYRSFIYENLERVVDSLATMIKL